MDLFQKDARRFYDEPYMRHAYPALFAEFPHPEMSSKYVFTNTYELVKHVRGKGFDVRTIQQQGKGKYGRVMVRLFPRGLDYCGSGCPEIVIVDSHDGTSKLIMRMGFVRFACSNGLIISDDFYKRSYRHTQEDMAAAFFLAVDDCMPVFDLLMSTMRKMQEHTTSEYEQKRLAFHAAAFRLKDVSKTSAHISQLATALLRTFRRPEDKRQDLFTVLNRVQENALRGGITYSADGRMHRLRPIASIQREMEINQAIWREANAIIGASNEVSMATAGD